MKVYVAYAMFNDSEKAEMTRLSVRIAEAGHDVFAPCKSGLVYHTMRYMMTEVLQLTHLQEDEVDLCLFDRVFSLDMACVFNCDAIVCNLNGRVPDDGMLVELGAAWAWGKRVVLYKDDARGVFNGRDNPLVEGTASFQIASSYAEVIEFLGKPDHTNTPSDAISRGDVVAELITKYTNDTEELCRQLWEM